MSALSNLLKGLRNRSIGPYGSLAIAEALAQTRTRVLGADTTLVPSDGAALTTAQYEINLSAGEVEVAGVYKRVAALSDQPIIGTDMWDRSVKLDGTAAVVLSADDKDYEVALVAALVDDVPTVFAVVGAEAATGAAEAPTVADCRAALELTKTLDADYDGLDTTVILLFGRILYERAGGAVTGTHSDPATDDVLKAARITGA